MKPPALDEAMREAHAMCANASCCYDFGWHIHCGGGCPCPDCRAFHAAIDRLAKVAALDAGERLLLMKSQRAMCDEVDRLRTLAGK